MEELYITVTISKDVLVRYERAAEALRIAFDAFDKAAKVLKEGTIDDGGAVEEAVEAVRKAKYMKAQYANLLAEEVVFAHEHPKTEAREWGKGKPKTRAEKSREAAEAIMEREFEKKHGCVFNSCKLPEEWGPDSDVKLQA